MLCVNKLINLVFNAKKIMQNTFCFPFFCFFIKKKITKQPKMKCMNVMQCKSLRQTKQKKKKKQRAMVTKSRAMKQKDHVKKTQLD